MENYEEYELIDGAYSVGESDRDFVIEGEVELPPLYNQDTIRFEMHQGSTPHCTLYGPMGAIADLFNDSYTQLEIDRVIKLSVERGKPIDKGWQTQLGVKCVCDDWNAHNDKKVVYYRIDIKSQNFEDALKKGYTVVVTYKGNGDYGRDVYDNACVDGVNFKPATYGHCTASIYLDGTGIKDSYKGRKGAGGIDTNKYKIADIQALVDNGVFYGSAYLILPQQSKSPEEIKRLMDMKALLNVKIDTNSKLWFMTNDPSYKETLNEENNKAREKIIDIDLELKKL